MNSLFSLLKKLVGSSPNKLTSKQQKALDIVYSTASEVTQVMMAKCSSWNNSDRVSHLLMIDDYVEKHEQNILNNKPLK